mgnify:FL=1
MPCERKSPFPPRPILSPEVIFLREEKKGFPYDPAPDVNRFPGVPESGFDLVNEYGTYNIQPTSHTENLFPLIGPELPERWRTMRLGKDDLEDL